MNSMQVKHKLKNFIKNKNISFSSALNFYVFDRFIIRLSKSKYKDNFIIKGGFLLSQLFGLNNRTTIDIDSALVKTNLTKENIVKMITSIINIDLDDNIKFTIKDITPIREEDEYGGYRVYLLFQFENIKEILKLDIATGDPITPKEISLNYETMLEKEKINVWTYNLETVIAEKIESIFSKLDASSRMKDYYDIYLIFTRKWGEINKKDLLKACNNTFKNRNFDTKSFENLEIIKNSEILKVRWKNYQKKYEFANEIEFEETIKCIEQILDVILPVNA